MSLELLESRRLMAGDVPYARADGGTLRVFGSDGDDQIVIAQSGSLDFEKILGGSNQIFLSTSVLVVANRRIIGSIDGQSLDRIIAYTGSGDDIVTIASGMRAFAYDAQSTSIRPRAFLYGEAGNDSLTGGDGDDVLIGGRGNDSLSGGAGNDGLRGEKGNDLLQPGLGDDHLSGGDGSDTVTYAERTGSVLVELEPVTGLIVVDRAYDPRSGEEGENDRLDRTVENAIGGAGDDKLLGNNEANVLLGGAGNDTLIGNDGDDYLAGGDGNDETDAVATLGTVMGSQITAGESQAGHDRVVGGLGRDRAVLDNTDSYRSVEVIDLRTASTSFWPG